MDVTKEDEVETGMEKALNAFGRFDMLVSNAGSDCCALDQFDPEVKLLRSTSTAPFDDARRLAGRCTIV